MMAPLPVWCEDPLERLSIVTSTMGDLKGSKQAVGANLLTELTDFAPPTIASQAARLQSRQRFFNLVVTNVPGPQFPLYVLGRKMRDIFPMVPLAKNQAVCVGIMSYDGMLNFGLIGDFEAMPTLESLGEDLSAALADLSAMVPGGATEAKPEASPRARERNQLELGLRRPRPRRATRAGGGRRAGRSRSRGRQRRPGMPPWLGASLPCRWRSS